MARVPFNARGIRIDLERDVIDVATAMGDSLLTTMVFATPVGNPSLWASQPPPGYVGGNARGEWQVSIGTATDAILGGVDSSGALTISRGRSQLARYDNLGQNLIVLNNAAHIGALNAGWSTQAPAGFVEAGVASALRALDDRRLV